jgi:probable HAF family extracellular repeat protein
VSQFCSELLERRVVRDANRQSSPHGYFHWRKTEDMNRLRQLRIFWIPWATTMVLACFSEGVAQTSYKVTDLGAPLNNWNLGCAMALNNHGWTINQEGRNFNGAPPVTALDTMNIGGLKIDLGTLGGTNSWMNWGGINDSGEAVGMSETSVPDPDGEDVCGFGTRLTCRGFLWQNGHMSALPTLGGNNGSASDINNRGQIAGTAETTVPDDSGCLPSNPAKFSLPVLWENGKIQQLPTVDDDPDGLSFAINDQGQAVGYSGTCTNAIHALLWENSTAFVLPDLGTGASAHGINNQGQIVGIIGSADGSTIYGALWQNRVLTNLGTLPGDFAALATGINSRGQVVGSTLDSSFSNWLHGFIWQNGVMTDLNTLIPADSNLFITMANKINERGQISGMATVLSGPHAGDVHAILATPVNASIGTSVADVARTHPHSNLPANAGKQLLQRFRVGRFGQ